MTPRELAAEAVLRASRVISRAVSRLTDEPQTSYISDEELAQSLGNSSVGDLAARLRDRRGAYLTPGLAALATTATTVRELFPESLLSARTQGDAILNHQISVFDRPCDLGRVIDWHRDPFSGLRWPAKHFSRVPLTLGHGADVRVVWELNRLQHFIALGRAYQLTGDERYTKGFLLDLASWHEANPPRFGPNWMNAMEPAIRAVNIIAALQMFSASPQVTDRAIELILKMLLAHGKFVRAHLEFSYRLSSNHFLSDLIGLYAIGMTMPELRESREWVSFSAERLLQEMDRQVLTDGVDYEGAVGYHRFVLEIFALFFSISRGAGVEIPGQYWERLEAMFDFGSHYLKPDGTAPRIGDSDDGRIIRFKARAPDDHSYLMSLGAILLENGRFKTSGRIDEEALWWFGERGRDAYESLAVNEKPPASRDFREGQVFIQRRDDLYAIVDCGDHGARGRGSHAHSDALSIEVFALGRTFIRDPGTFVYTGSERWRNQFRSTAYHNTVRIDGEEISPITEGELFTLGSNVRPRVILWESDDDRDVLDAEHDGYRRLAAPVTHRRVVTLDKRERHWTIQDIFSGEGRHRFEFFFNLDSGLETQIEPDRVIAQDARVALAIVPISGNEFEVKVVTRWVSPAYGTRIRSSAIMYRLDAEVPFENVIRLIPYARGEDERAADSSDV